MISSKKKVSPEKRVTPEKTPFVDIVPRDENCGDTGLLAGMFGSINIIRPGMMGLLVPDTKKDPKPKEPQPEQSDDEDLTSEEQYIKDGILACADSDTE